MTYVQNIYGLMENLRFPLRYPVIFPIEKDFYGKLKIWNPTPLRAWCLIVQAALVQHLPHLVSVHNTL